MFKVFSVLFVLLAVASGYTPALAQALIGETTALTQADGGNANLLLAQNATLTQKAVLNSLSFYVTSTTNFGNIILGLYDATGPNGGPGTLVAQTASFVPVHGWNTKITATQPTLNPGKYWLAHLPSSNSLSYVKGQGDGSLVNQYGTWTFSAVTNQFGNGILLNGAPAGVGAAQGFSTLLLSYNNLTYAFTTGSWFQWNGTGWVGVSGDPRTGTNGGTTITNVPMGFVYASRAFGAMPSTFPALLGSDTTTHWSVYATLTPTVALGTITGESLSGTSTPGGASSGATIGTVGVTMSSGSFTGTLALSDNTNFQLTSPTLPSTLQTKTSLTVGSTYPLTITATETNAGGSPFSGPSNPFAITATGITGVSLIDGPFGGSQFVGGSPSGTVVGQIKVTEAFGGTFGGTYALSDTVPASGDSANFQIVGGFLETSGIVAAGTYKITITATQSGVGGSPKAVPFVITGTSSGAQQWLFLTANQTFSPTAHNLIAGTPVTLEAVGSGSGGAATNDDTGGCGGAYAHQLTTPGYLLTATDVSNGMAAIVGAAGAVGAAGHTSSVADGTGALLVSAGGGGAAAGGCTGGSVIVGAGYSGGAGGAAPGEGGGGGGGSAGPAGPGGAGGVSTAFNPAGGGGGGAANGLGSAATTSTATGGKGGGASGGAGGAGNTTGASGAPGTLGGGGGGGGAVTSGAGSAGNGGVGGLVCNIWDSTHCLGGGPGGGGSAISGRGGSAGAPNGYGCGGAGFGDTIPSLATAGNDSAGCPGLVVIGWNGSPPIQSLSSITLTGNSYTVGAVANTVIGTIAVGMTPALPPFNYPTSTITVSDSTHFKVVNVGNVPTLEANATLSASSYTTTITATQSGATGSPFTSGTQTITGRSLSMTVTPVVPSISSASPGGFLVATLQGVWSNGDPFTGTYGFVGNDSSPGNYGSDGNTFSIVPGPGSGAQLQVNPTGPGVGFDGGTVQNVTAQATQ